MTTNSTIQRVERRQGKRILTLKNSLRATVVVLIAFTAISVASEFRGTESGQLGRLYQKRPAVTQLQVEKPQVIVKEAPGVTDQDLADPLTVEAMRREQILGVTGSDPLDPRDPRDQVQLSSTAEYLTPEFRPADPLDLNSSKAEKGKARFAIEGGAGGVYTRYDQ